MTFARRLKTTVALGGLLLALPSLALSATADSPKAQVDEIIVTGTRVKSKNSTSLSPILTVKSEALQSSGLTSIENAINALPQVTGSHMGGQSTFGTPGIATVNLRNLGVVRTLVLVDNKRLMVGDPVQPFSDINIVPMGMVASVDVVTGGASAVYGSDAVAGVVNFKLKRNQTGLRFDYQVSAAQHDNNGGSMQALLRAGNVTVPGEALDGLTHDLTLSGGLNTPDARGNVTAYLGYRKIEPIKESERDFSACGLGTVSTTLPYDAHVCSGSGTSAFGRFRTGGTGTGFAANPDGSNSFVHYAAASMAYNSNKETFLQRGDERFTGGLFATYNLTDTNQVYLDVIAMDDRNQAQIAPVGIVSNRTYSINCSNPLLSAAQQAQLCGAAANTPDALWKGTIAKRIELGDRPRFYDLRHTDYRITVGNKGVITDRLSYEIYAQYGRVDYRNLQTNDVSVSRVQDSLLAGLQNGKIVCLSGTRGCEPLNLFQLGKISKEAADYIFTTAKQTGHVTQTLLSGTLSGDLGEAFVSPLSSNPIRYVVGAEYRRDSIALTNSANILSGDLASFGGTAPAQGATEVRELFVEAQVPLIADRPLIKDLSLNLAYRTSDYSLSGQTQTYRASLAYVITPEWRLRGGYNRAVRAPNSVELFAPLSLSTASIIDTCSGSKPTASLEQCQLSGVTPAQYGLIAPCSSNYCTTRVGGNLALKPETADTYTVGLVWEPKLLKTASFSIDYYQVEVRDLIGTLSAPVIFNQCQTQKSAFYCGLIHRDPTGSLSTTGGYIQTTNINTGFLKTSGLDVSGDYSLPLEALNLGKAALAFRGTWTEARKVSPLSGASAYECAGLYGPTCGAPLPQWRHTFHVAWQTPWTVQMNLAWRHIGGSSVDINDSNPIFSGATSGKKDIADAKIHAVNYIDLSGNIPLNANYNLRFGVRNLFDKAPPLVDNFNLGINSQFGNANSFPGLYDTLGRTLFIGLSGQF